MCLTCRATEKDPRQGGSLSAWMGEDWPKRPSDRQLQDTQKHTLIGPWRLRQRQSMSLHAWCRQGPLKPSSCANFTSNLTGGNTVFAAIGKKLLHLACRVTSVVYGFATLQTVACQASLSGTRVLQARILECSGQYWLPYLLEHYISCCPSHQSPWEPGAARTPATQAAVPPSHLALTGADPSLPGQPEEQTPVDNPLVEVEIKPQLNPGAVWLRKKTQSLPGE